MRKIHMVILFAVTLTFAKTTHSQQSVFVPLLNYPITNTASNNVAIGDCNNDGKKDVVVLTCDFNTDYSFRVYYQNNSGSLSNTPTIYGYPPHYPGARAVAISDVDGDNLADIIIGQKDSIYIFRQTSTHTFVLQTALYCGSDVEAMKIFDVDEDGKEDIVISLWNSPFVCVYYNEANWSPSRITYPAYQAGWDDIEAGKLGTDSVVSILKSCGQTSNAPVVRLRIGHNRLLLTTFEYHISNNPSDIPHGIAIADWNGDGLKDFGVSYGGNMPSARFAVWGNISSVYPDSTFTVFQAPQAVKSANMNCDGKEEFVVLHGGWNAVSVSSPVWGMPSFYVSCPNNSYPDGLALGDVTGDGKVDIVVVNSYSGLSVLQNVTTCSVLAADGINFSATLDKAIIRTKWTASGQRFEVERSANSANWEYVGATTTSRLDDMHPLVGRSYYRLKVFNPNGVFRYSEIVSVVYLPNKVTVRPTITSNMVTVAGIKPGASVQVYSINGTLVFSKTASATSMDISMSGYSNGMYVANVNGLSTKIIKQ